MPSVQNTERLAEIKEDLTDIQAMWVVDYRGLTVKQSEQLRNSIREAGAIMKVHKNKLVRLALKELDMPEMDEVLAGPSAFVFAEGDPVASAKQLKRSQLFLLAKNSSPSFSAVFRTLWSKPYACSTAQWRHLHAAYLLSQIRRMQLKSTATDERHHSSSIRAA